ncbi:hypothetical protein ACQKWADRAFT_210587 [Trichoderma austrokoningii]
MPNAKKQSENAHGPRMHLRLHVSFSAPPWANGIWQRQRWVCGRRHPILLAGRQRSVASRVSHAAVRARSGGCARYPWAEVGNRRWSLGGFWCASGRDHSSQGVVTVQDEMLDVCITCPGAAWGTPSGLFQASRRWRRASGALEPSWDAAAVEGARPTAIPVAANGAVQVTCLAAVAAAFFFLSGCAVAVAAAVEAGFRV